jgi:DNA mismatch repair protein MLH1
MWNESILTTAGSDEHFYQIGLRQFGAFHRIKLEPAPSLSDLLEIAIEDEGDKIRSNGLDTTKVHAGVLDLLMDKREMVDEYFSLRITEDGLVETLPLVLKGYMPNLDRLPHFLLCLATEVRGVSSTFGARFDLIANVQQVDWTDEKACFDSILKELAFFYSPRPASDHVEDALTQGDGIEGEEAANQRWQLEHVLFPSFRKHTQWPKELIGPHVQQVANLPDLFRIFERC